MKPERIEQIDQIFQSALDLVPERRSMFLDAACGEDIELRAEVESLLSAHRDAGDFIEDSASDVAASLLEKIQRRTQVGQYKIERLLGAGGMGEVYLATDKMGRRVALKLLTSQHDDQQPVSRFLQEARTVLALNHPHIVTLYDIGESDGTYYIASELIEGENLRQYAETAKLELGTVLEILIQVSTAVAAAHEKGVVHRDIKPENVMLRRDGYVKVLDFGIAKLTEDFGGAVSTDAPTRPNVKTAEGVVIGTASYMSPEQARGLTVDARTDIWSCGVMLYEMLAGQAPFAGGSAAEIVAHILDQEPMPLARYMTDPPSELQRIINKALVKNREERYQSIKDMLLDLKALKQEMEFTAKLKRSVLPSAEASTGEARERSVRDTPSSMRPVGERLTTNGAGKHAVSSAEYIASEIKQHKLGFVVLSVLLLVASVTGYWFFIHRSSNVKTIETIAVMPFENTTQDQDSEYISDGVTESLINSLSQLPDIRVIARNSAFSYKNQPLDLQQVARKLNVQAILTGRVLAQGDTLRISVELTDTQNNTQLWGQRYTGKASEIFVVQDDIARQVIDKLRVRLTGGQQEQITKHYTENAQAYRLYLQGRYYFNQYSEENLNRSISFFDQAIALDPRYALAYAARAQSFSSLGDFLPNHEGSRKAKQDIAMALSLDDRLVEARATQGQIKAKFDWDFAGAEEDFKRAIALNPNNAEGHHQYAFFLALMGRPTESVAEMKLAQQLDPVNPHLSVDVSLPYYLARQFDQSILHSRKALEMFPNFFLGHRMLGIALFEKGDQSTGIEELQKAKALEPKPPLISMLGYAYAKAGRKDEARKLLAELKELSKQRPVAPYLLAMIYAGLDEKDEAFAWLEEAYQERSWWLHFIKMDPMVDSLRSDARFSNLMLRIEFPQ